MTGLGTPTDHQLAQELEQLIKGGFGPDQASRLAGLLSLPGVRRRAAGRTEPEALLAALKEALKEILEESFPEDEQRALTKALALNETLHRPDSMERRREAGQLLKVGPKRMGVEYRTFKDRHEPRLRLELGHQLLRHESGDPSSTERDGADPNKGATGMASHQPRGRPAAQTRAEATQAPPAPADSAEAPTVRRILGAARRLLKRFQWGILLPPVVVALAFVLFPAGKEDRDALARETVARETVGVINAGALDRLKQTLASDALLEELATGRRARGPDQQIHLIMRWKKAIPDLRGEITDVFRSQSSDRVALAITWRGTHSGPLELPCGTIPPSGKHVTLRAILVMKIRDDTIYESRHYFDLESLLHEVAANRKALGLCGPASPRS